jgi:hypothetical protein
MHTLWNADDRSALLARVARLSPDAAPAWGSMNAPRMVTHLVDALRMATGDLVVAPKASPLSLWPLNSLIMFHLPWPKSAPTAPELIARAPGHDWSTSVAELKAAMDRFASQDVNRDWPRHPVFGSIGGTGWGRLAYRHTEHHLTQFRG